MVDLSQVSQITNLYMERGQVEAAIRMIDGGAVIEAMTLAVPSDANLLTVPTRHMIPPEKMMPTIKQNFQARLKDIDKELSDLGITKVTK